MEGRRTYPRGHGDEALNGGEAGQTQLSGVAGDNGSRRLAVREDCGCRRKGPVPGRQERGRGVGEAHGFGHRPEHCRTACGKADMGLGQPRRASNERSRSSTGSASAAPCRSNPAAPAHPAGRACRRSDAVRTCGSRPPSGRARAARPRGCRRFRSGLRPHRARLRADCPRWKPHCSAASSPTRRRVGRLWHRASSPVGPFGDRGRPARNPPGLSNLLATASRVAPGLMFAQTAKPGRRSAKEPGPVR